MPLYEYQCSICGEVYQLLRRMSELNDPAPCEATSDCGGLGERILSLFSSLKTTSTADSNPAEYILEKGLNRQKQMQKKER